MQGTIRTDAPPREGRTDDVLGAGLTLVVDGAVPAPLVARAVELDVRVVALGAGVADVDGALTAWLRGHGVTAALSRPDGYVFGTAESLAGIPALLDELAARLG